MSPTRSDATCHSSSSKVQQEKKKGGCATSKSCVATFLHFLRISSLGWEGVDIQSEIQFEDTPVPDKKLVNGGTQDQMQ